MTNVTGAIRRLRRGWCGQSKATPAAEIRRRRRKLKLTHAQLASSFGVGKVALSRYERGETRPPTPLLKLLKLIDRHPDLLEEIEKM